MIHGDTERKNGKPKNDSWSQRGPLPPPQQYYVIATNSAGWFTAQIRLPYGLREGTGVVLCRQSTSRDGAVGRGRKEAVRLAVTATLRESRVIHHPHSYLVVILQAWPSPAAKLLLLLLLLLLATVSTSSLFSSFPLARTHSLVYFHLVSASYSYSSVEFSQNWLSPPRSSPPILELGLKSSFHHCVNTCYPCQVSESIPCPLSVIANIVLSLSFQIPWNGFLSAFRSLLD